MKKQLLNTFAGKLQKLIFVICVIAAASSSLYAADESFTGVLSLSDSHAGDLDSDLEISYEVQSSYTGTGSSKEYSGFILTGTGKSDGACLKLKLLLNQKLCSNARIKVEVPQEDSDGDLEILTGDFFTTKKRKKRKK